MEKTKKEQAIKKLQTELKEEKQAEIQRCALLCVSSSIDNESTPDGSHRRKDITMERKKAAEERRRLEEEKAKVRTEACYVAT